MLRLECDVKQYGWGQPGSVSLVADLAASGDANHQVDPTAPYAELWMGVHVSGPSIVSNSKEPLDSWLNRNPRALGNEVLARYGSSLPFLFKVLSVQKSLSIQSHPDKKLAERLHSDRPSVYKDDNHKPEIALAVEGFKALCGFCSMHEISSQLQAKPELRKCVGDAEAQAIISSVTCGQDQRRKALKAAFTALMTCEEAIYNEASNALYKQLKSACSSARSEKEDLFITIFNEYPGDVGTLAVFFLNYVKLQPGEAIYMAANEPHAYLSGELVEAMANSDNVIRAGLTPKLRDTEVLCESLTYTQGPPHMLIGQQVSDCIQKYQPPFDEFQVLSVLVDKEGSVSMPAQNSPMLLLCLSCQGAHSLVSHESTIQDHSLEEMVSLKKGTVLFIPAYTEMKLHSMATPDSRMCSLLAYAATANDHMFVNEATKEEMPVMPMFVQHATT